MSFRLFNLVLGKNNEMKSLFVFVLIFCTFHSIGQVPEPAVLSLKVFAGDGGDQIVPYVTQSADGGSIIHLGTTSLTGPITDTFCAAEPSFGQAIFVKFNSDASSRGWYKCRKSSWSDTSYVFMFQTADNNIIIGGMTNSGNKWIIRKEDSAGNVLWMKAYGGSGSQMLYSMAPTVDGGFVLFGSAYGNDGDIGFHYGSAGTRDFWVLKIDAYGDKQWSKVYGGTGEDIGGSVLLAPDGGYYIIGSTTSTDNECNDNHGLGDVFVARLDSNGGIVWHRCYGGSGSDGGEVQGCRAVLNGKGGVLIAAKTGSSDGDVSHKINVTGYNFWLLNLSDVGSIIWDNCYGGGGAEIPSSMCLSINGSIWMIGISHLASGQVNMTYGGSSDAYVVHADSNGNFLSAKVLGSSGQDVGYMICPLSDGSVLAGGYYGAGDGVFPSTLFGSAPDAFLVRLSNWPANIDVLSAETSFSVYPNPTTDWINIHSGRSGYARIQINDAIGREMYRGVFTNELSLPILDWHKGFYYVHVIDNESQDSYIQKLIIQ